MTHELFCPFACYLNILKTYGEEGNQRLPGMDAALYVKPKTWGDLDHFKERLDFMCTQAPGRKSLLTCLFTYRKPFDQ